MKRSSRGYGSYRGRSDGGVLKAVIAILAVILLLAVAAFFALKPYMVYSDDGTSYLDLPFLNRQTPEPSSAPVIQTLIPAPTPTPEPTPPPKPEKVLPVSLPLEALLDGTAAELVAEGGGTAAVFDMKLESGELAWQSGNPIAVRSGVSQRTSEVNQALKAAAEEDAVYRIARISCFKDHTVTGANRSLAVMANNGDRWMDSDSIRWLSPANSEAREYIAALCVELAELGFDEILLDHAGYPVRGKLRYIQKDEAYDAERLEEVISAFYQELEEALEGKEVALSAVYDPENTALSGQSEKGLKAAGITPVTLDEDGRPVWP